MEINTIFSKNDEISKRNIQELKYARDAVMNGETVKMFFPLWIGLSEDDWWSFPIEPLISISGKNVIVKRNVAKSDARGTVKERWTEDDLSINIQGMLRHDDLYTYPSDDVKKLKSLITQKQVLYVKSELFLIFNISQIVVESFSFPFSKGENVQNYIIEAVSDDIYNLFIDTK